MNIIKLTDVKATPDIFYEYNNSFQREDLTIVIDNGSYKCRVGWNNCETPLLEFRNIIAKPRKDRKKDAVETSAIPPIQIGNDIINVEAVRLQLKTQFDRNLVTHFYNQEHIFDYAFSHLNIDYDGSVPHPIVLTEAFGNPNFCRQQMNELLFECYGVPALCYGIDSLFSWQQNKQCLDSLIISFGYHATHVIPVLGGCIQADRVRRINVGGYHIITYLYRLMQMKYPVHLNAITVSRMEALLHHHSSVTLDYLGELRHWTQSEFYAQNVKKIQLPYTAPIQSATLTTEQRNEKRRELARRLIETNARRSKEKQMEDEQQLQILSTVRKLYERGDIDKFQMALQDNELGNLEELDKLVTVVRTRIERTKQKLQASLENAKNPIKPKVPAIVKPPAELSLENWLDDVKVKRIEILNQKQLRKTRRQDLAKRHTVAAQERMRIISLLARNDKGTDEFGMNENDWDVYKVINRANDSDSDTENEKLNEYDSILRYYDPCFEMPHLLPDAVSEQYQLHVGVESLRAPELLFQPSMIGSSECGISELIQYVLNQFIPSEQQRMVNNVFMTGGCAQFPGLKERISKELLAVRPFQTTHAINVAKSPEIDAWLGARNFTKNSNYYNVLTTKKDYDENGPEYFKYHDLSNMYYPTPKP